MTEMQDANSNLQMTSHAHVNLDTTEQELVPTVAKTCVMDSVGMMEYV